MNCKNCREKPVFLISENNQRLCKRHFIEYFEKKVWRTIKNFKLIGKKEKIVVALSGGKDSTTVLYLLNKISKQNKKINVEALLIDEGIKGYRNKTIIDAKRFCRKNKIKLHIVSFKKEFGKNLDEIVRKFKNPCTICGILRRELLNRYAKRLGATAIATGHNLDDECQSILMNQMKNDIKRSARLGPKSGIMEIDSFVKRIKPLYFMKEKEIMAYSYLIGISPSFNECPYTEDSFRAEIRNILNEIEARHPGTKNSIINSFLEILPELKKRYDEKMKFCKYCENPVSEKREVCNACELIKKIKDNYF